MKKINTLLLYIVALGIGSVVVSCKEDAPDIFTMFKDVKVTFHGDHPFSVTDYKLVNDMDSVYIDYTITSGKEDMYSVVEEKTDGGSPARTTRPVDETQRKSFSRVLKLQLRRDGKTVYRIYALNKEGVYIGDGYTKVVIEGRPSYRLIADRKIFAPDSVEKVQPSFFSIADGKSYSYSNGNENSADIDFGVWRRSKVFDDGSITYSYNYYSLATAENPFPIYDISGWEKRGTKFSAIINNGSATFQSLLSSNVIETLAKARNLNVTTTDFTPAAPTATQTGLIGGSLVYFLTPEGKYGAFLVNQNTKDHVTGNAFLNISVKIQN